jgi:hypothetical protein
MGTREVKKKATRPGGGGDLIAIGGIFPNCNADAARKIGGSEAGSISACRGFRQ